jgi:phosphatidylglycerophosphate synthase
MFCSGHLTPAACQQRLSVRKLTSNFSFRIFAVLLGIGLMTYLVVRTGPQMIWSEVRTVGWGMALIIVLGGVAHLLKTWAWRLTFRSDIGGLSWPRSFGMRLISEAIGQVGIAGKIFGEGMRVSMLGSAASNASGISAAALDSGLYIFSSAIVTVLGIACVLLLAPVSHKWRAYAFVFSGGLLVSLALFALAIGKRWQVLTKITRAIGRVSPFQKWVSRKQSVVEATEENLFSFHREAPRAFWGSFGLNFACHALAVGEVYLVLRFMGFKVALLGALMLEGLTKLINSVGALNPGNVGTYEGGNVLITKLLGITSSSGLTLALCRRLRAMFWAAVGAVCLMVMKRTTRQDTPDPDLSTPAHDPNERETIMSTMQQKVDSQSAIIFANCERHPRFLSSIATVGTLPVLLRTILTLHASGIDRIVVCVPAASAQDFKSTLLQTKRLPSSVEWREVGPHTNLSSVVTEVAAWSQTVMLLLGNRIYQPAMLHSAAAWTGNGTLAIVSNNAFAGVHVLSKRAAIEVAKQSATPESDVWGASPWKQPVEIREVASGSWHNIVTPEDLPLAERKLNAWLVKPTDGLFAQMNRKVSIPISRQLIKFPITPNMVTFFVLGVSFASGLFFARGGYWSILLGAALSVAASILDGSDGEVARLKLQSSKFGCWLETVCDYLYYLFVFGGMAVGLTRTYGNKSYLAWGSLLCFGAIMSFLTVGYTRQRLSGAQPEKFLAVWQEKAEGRPSNPLLFLGRHTEFIIRRCFFPYALLVFALFNMTRFAFIATSVGANIVWMIALYSVITFTLRTKSFAAHESPAVCTVTGD